LWPEGIRRSEQKKRWERSETGVKGAAGVQNRWHRIGWNASKAGMLNHQVVRAIGYSFLSQEKRRGQKIKQGPSSGLSAICPHIAHKPPCRCFVHLNRARKTSNTISSPNCQYGPTQQGLSPPCRITTQVHAKIKLASQTRPSKSRPLQGQKWNHSTADLNGSLCGS
jgi:hypothetical protein